MNLIECVESQLKATLDKCALEKYGTTATTLEVLEKVKLQLVEKEQVNES